MTNGIASMVTPAVETTSALPAPLPRFVNLGYSIAFIAVTLAGLAQVSFAPAGMLSKDRFFALAAASTLYALLGTAGLSAIERRAGRSQLQALIAAMLALGAASTLYSHGYSSMMLLAVVSTAVLHLGTLGGAVVSATCAVVALSAFAMRATLWGAFLQAGIAFGSGIAFVFVFSRIALREQHTRARAEQLADQLASANEQLRAREAEVEQLATVRERNRIAREIHDGLGHYLTVVHIQLEAAKTLFTSDPERARTALVRSQHLTHEGLSEVRRSVALLRGATHARPLVDSLHALADEGSAPGLKIDVQVEGSVRRLAEPIEFTLYRAAQEALTNVRRHSRASRAEITIAFYAGAVRLRIADDGIGAAASAGEGFGLPGLRERAQLVGGKLAIRTRANDGFTLELEVPA
jgi:signal transduction histidine kinase